MMKWMDERVDGRGVIINASQWRNDHSANLVLVGNLELNGNSIINIEWEMNYETWVEWNSIEEETDVTRQWEIMRETKCHVNDSINVFNVY